MIADFEVMRPTSLPDALAAVAAGGQPYCGGTELVAAMQMGLLAPEALVDLKRVPGLASIEYANGVVGIGSTVRHRAVAASAVIARDSRVLGLACAALGNQRVRATGSLAGNLCFAEPRSDVTTALLALDAQVVLQSMRGERSVALDAFLLGAMDTSRDEDEVMVRIDVPIVHRPQVYLRFQPAVYPTVVVAVIGGGAAREDVRVVVGAVGERPQLFTAASTSGVDVEGIVAQLDVLEDLNGAEDYKRHVAGVYLRRALRAVEEQTWAQ